MEKTLRELTEELTLRDERLLESEQMFRTAFCINPIPMAITTMEGRYVKVNHAFTDVSGYDEEEVIGKTLFELGMYMKESDRQIIVDAVKRNAVALKIPMTYKGKGKIVYTEITTKVITIRGVDHFLSIIEDVTYRRYHKRLEDEQQQ